MCRTKAGQFPSLRWSRRRIHAILQIVAASAALAGVVAADERNPSARDPKAAKAGEYEFRINCALCHGLGAHGGGRGPDLTRSHKKHAQSDAELFQVVS